MLLSLRFTSIILATAVATTAPLSIGDGVQLRWKFKEGDVLRYRMTQLQETQISMMPDHALKNEMVMVLHEDVKSVGADGTGVLEVGYEAIKMDADMGMGSMSYDSTLKGADAKGNDATLAAMFDPLLEAKLKVTMETTGHVSEITGLKEMLEKMTKATEDEENPMMSQMMKRMFSDESMRKMMEVSIFPDKALAVGDTWKRSFDQPNPMIGTMKFTVESKFEGSEDHRGQACAKISLETGLKLEKTDATEGAPHMSVEMEDSDGTGTMWFGTKSGRLVDMTQTMDIKMKMGGSVEVNATTTTSMLLIGKDDPMFESPDKKPADAKK